MARIPDTLVYAMEFITLPTPNEQQNALDHLRKEVLRSHPELKAGPSDYHIAMSVINNLSSLDLTGYRVWHSMTA